MTQLKEMSTDIQFCRVSKQMLSYIILVLVYYVDCGVPPPANHSISLSLVQNEGFCRHLINTVISEVLFLKGFF